MSCRPTVCAVMLTANRPELARRAVECFRAQTYSPRFMLELDSGAFTKDSHFSDWRMLSLSEREAEAIFARRFGRLIVEGCRGLSGRTIGELRNAANEFAVRHFSPDILIHFDDDDWSHPERISEQVALLESSGADVVGYREMLFWREGPGEAWIYSNPDPRYALGTSLCYWRKTWERKPFEETSNGEDTKFITGLNCVGDFSFPGEPPETAKRRGLPDVSTVMKYDIDEPRMIARIHAGNTSNQYAQNLLDISNRVKGGPWRRVPEWDAYTRSIMEAA